MVTVKDESLNPDLIPFRMIWLVRGVPQPMTTNHRIIVIRVEDYKQINNGERFYLGTKDGYIEHALVSQTDAIRDMTAFYIAKTIFGITHLYVNKEIK